ncbi:hypothetical protein H3966_12020 [Staphylococcus epidermidis]|uniref:hypothetical protein n=1 Tax=Staphylococcus TaxID=1279 RepID=UPI00160B10EA|nr:MULTISPECIES: hypothetical protein [Staphylococcus]MBF2224121.1 hypothetical protein [Staphylococcus epidermidis]MBF2226504.1 hypothetical protein [Staphylococcus epidermidis]
MPKFKATQKIIRTETRYIEAGNEMDALELLEDEDAGEDGAIVNDDYGEWTVEEV